MNKTNNYIFYFLKTIIFIKLKKLQCEEINTQKSLTNKKNNYNLFYFLGEI